MTTGDLLNDYKEIVIAWSGVEKSTVQQLTEALSKFTDNVVKENDLLHDIASVDRKYCEECATWLKLGFGQYTFCPDCGAIVPF